MKKILGYLPFGTYSHSNPAYPFHRQFTAKQLDFRDPAFSEDVAACDAVIIWGGADIGTQLYNEQLSNHPACHADTLSVRDIAEAQLFREAVTADIPIIGICRGAQLACALSGGTLIQHCENHAHGDHEIITNEMKVYETSSVHHQMMYPFNVEHVILAWALNRLSNVYAGPGNSHLYPDVEPEVVWFPKTRALCIQGHPEFMKEDCPFNDYVRSLINTFVTSTETI